MTTGRRISITVYSALALGVDVVGAVLSHGLVFPSPWLTAFFVLSGLTIVGVFFVDRWWALFPALTTVAAFWLGNAIANTEHSGSYELIPAEYVGPLFVLPVLIGVAVLSVGLLARTIWDHFLQPESSTTDPNRSDR